MFILIFFFSAYYFRFRTKEAKKEDASIFKCDHWYYFTHSKHWLSVHRGAKHRGCSTISLVINSLIQSLSEPFPANLQNMINHKPKELGSWNFEIMFTLHTVWQSGEAYRWSKKTIPSMLEFTEHKSATNYRICCICKEIFSNCSALTDLLKVAHKKTQHWITNDSRL